MRDLEQERQNTDEAKLSWYMRYGFHHDCHCADDVREGNTQEVPICWALAADEAFKLLEQTRGMIYGILHSGSTDAEAIKKQLAITFYGETLEA